MHQCEWCALQGKSKKNILLAALASNCLVRSFGKDIAVGSTCDKVGGMAEVWRLILKTLDRAVWISLSEGSSTVLSVLYLTFGGILVGGLFTVIIEWNRGGRSLSSLKTAFSTWPAYAGGFLGAAVLWLALILWHIPGVITTAYQGHIRTINSQATDIQTDQNRLKAVQANPKVITKPSGSVVIPLPTASASDTVIQINRRMTKADRERFANALFDFSATLDQANSLLDTANLESAKLRGTSSGGPIRDFGTRREELSSIESSAKEFIKTFASIRDRWRFYQEQTLYVFTDNPDNNGGYTIMNAANEYGRYIDNWTKSFREPTGSAYSLFEVEQNRYEASIYAFSAWRRGCAERLQKMKDSIK